MDPVPPEHGLAPYTGDHICGGAAAGTQWDGQAGVIGGPPSGPAPHPSPPGVITVTIGAGGIKHSPTRPQPDPPPML